MNKQEQEDLTRYLKNNYTMNQLIEKYIEDILWLQDIINMMKQKGEE